MIEIRKNEQSNNNKFELLIDGSVIEHAHVFAFRRENDKKDRVFVHTYEVGDSERARDIQ